MLNRRNSFILKQLETAKSDFSPCFYSDELVHYGA